MAFMVGMGAGMHVLIVGGGPVGLLVAYLAARRGMRVTLVERDGQVSRQLRASTFHPPTLDMLDELGLGELLHRHGRVTPCWQIRQHESGARAVFDLGVLAGETRHPYRLQVEQWHLSQALLARLKAMPGVELRFGETALAVRGARVETERAVVEGDVVVGCDGAKSLVRQAMGARFEGSTYPETTVLLTTRFDFGSVFEGLSGVNYIWRGDGTYSLLHLPDLWRVSIHPRRADWDEAHIRAELAAIVSAEIEILELRAYRVHQRLASTYRQGSMLLAGDAAHLNSPKGGMGLNGGIHDAFALVAALADGSDAALARYARVRRAVADEDIIKQADANRARMGETDPLARARRLAELQAIAADPARARQFLRRSSMLEGLARAEAMA